METPLRLWLDAYRAPLIPIPQEFSWQCDLGRWRSLEPCFALCVKIIIIIQYATMWLPLHTEVQYLHSGYQILVNLCIFTASVCSTGSSCGQQVSTLSICQTFVVNHALFNACCSIYLFLAQRRLVLPWKCCFTCFHKVSHDIIIYYCHYYHDNGSQLLSRCTTRYMNYFTCDVKLTWNYRKMVQ